jgi:L-fuculose-phosphate aldolase
MEGLEMPDETNSGFFDRDDAENRARADRDMKAHLGPAAWPMPLKMALACRKLASECHAETLAGQVTARAAEGGFWTNPIVGGFANIRQGTVLRVDEVCEVVAGQGIPNPGVRFHLWVYRARPDVQAIVHTHPPHAAALSMTGRELAVAHMDVAMFHDDCAYLPVWPGVPVANEEGRIISEALGNRRAILLANHGLLTVGKSLEEAAYLALQFERAARLQILAESIGEIQPIDPAHARDAHDFLLQDSVVYGTFNAWAEELLRGQPDVRD